MSLNIITDSYILGNHWYQKSLERKIQWPNSNLSQTMYN